MRGSTLTFLSTFGVGLVRGLLLNGRGELRRGSVGRTTRKIVRVGANRSRSLLQRRIVIVSELLDAHMSGHTGLYITMASLVSSLLRLVHDVGLDVPALLGRDPDFRDPPSTSCPITSLAPSLAHVVSKRDHVQDLVQHCGRVHGERELCLLLLVHT